MQTPSLKDVQAFLSSQEVIDAVAEIIVRTAHAESVAAHVSGYLLPAFAEFRPFYDEDERLTDPEDLYLSDDPADDWYAHCDELHRANGYDLEPGFCPVSMAQSARVSAETALVEMFTERFVGGRKIWNPSMRAELLAKLTRGVTAAAA